MTPCSPRALLCQAGPRSRPAERRGRSVRGTGDQRDPRRARPRRARPREDRYPGDRPDTDTPVRIAGCPAQDEADVLGLEMVRHLLDPAGHRMEVNRTGIPVVDVLAWVDLHRPALVCIGAVAPGSLSQARHLCKRLRSQSPELRIVVGRWGLHDEMDADRQQLLEAGADHVETTVLDTQRTLVRVGLAPGTPPGADAGCRGPAMGRADAGHAARHAQGA